MSNLIDLGIGVSTKLETESINQIYGTFMTFDRLKIFGRLSGLSLLVLATLACYPDQNMSTFFTDGPVAKRQLDVFWWILAGGMIVTVLVEAALIYAIFKYRRKSEDYIPYQTHGNNKLELTWTIIPVILLAILMVPIIQTLFYSANTPDHAKAEYTLDAIGHQWWFEFRYPNPVDPGSQIVTANEVYIPVNEPIAIRLESEDVIHSFWVPKLAGKVDMVPSNGNTMWFQADKVGEYFGQCAEYCGSSHANMKFKVIAVEKADFDAWLSHQASKAVEHTDPLAKTGAALFKDLGCSGCHSLKPEINLKSDGSIAKGRVGPNLAHLASRRHLLAGMLENSNSDGSINNAYLQDNLRNWLQDPDKIKPGNIMSSRAQIYTDPNKSLTEEQLSALVSYLTTLK